jgi:hypothetical protein
VRGCEICNGNGRILTFPRLYRSLPPGYDCVEVPCPYCEGTGVEEPEPLPDENPALWLHRVPAGAR